MFRIQLLNAIAATGLAQLPAAHYQTDTAITQPDALLVRSHDLHDFHFPDSVLVVGRAGVGVNTIPVAALTARGIPVMNTPGANTNAVRELVLAGMLLACRHLCQAADYVRHLQVADDASLHAQLEKDKKQFAGFELRGRTLGVVGLGNIGVKVANAASALGMHIIGYDPAITVKNAWELSADVRKADTLQDIVQHADFITVHVPLIEATRYLINADLLRQCRPGTVLLNFSRSEIVDADAVTAALQSNVLSSYVTDFPALQFKDHPHVICLPHLGASTREAEENCAVMIVKQVRDYLEKGIIHHAVNFPEIDMRSNHAATRLGLIHTNTPGRVADISHVLATEKINIMSMQNGSRDAIAYTLIDTDTPVAPALLQALAKIEGMTRVRVMPA